MEQQKRTRRVTCIALRRIGVEGHMSERGFENMAEVGEEVKLPRDIAMQHQDSGAVKIKL